jgi:hypothetical protein
MTSKYHQIVPLRPTRIFSVVVHKVKVHLDFVGGGASSVPNILSQNRLVTPNPFS